MLTRSPSRFARVVLSTLSACAALALPACGPASTGAQGPSTDVAAPSIHSFTSDQSGFDTRSYWLDTGSEVVVFDAQFTEPLAQKLVASIRATTRSKIAWVVVTHPNPDKFNGAAVFQREGAKVVASKSTAAAIPGVHAYKKAYFVDFAKMFTADTYPPLATVDVTFEGTTTLPLASGARVELRELRHAGVSTTQTVGWVPQAKALFVGDLVHHRAHAWLEGGIRDGAPHPDVDAWLAALDELGAFPGATVHGGRGGIGTVEEVVPAEQRYLRTMRDVVTRYVAALPDKKALDAADASKHWKALAALGTQAFPDYELPYMIEYGVYGLAKSIR